MKFKLLVLLTCAGLLANATTDPAASVDRLFASIKNGDITGLQAALSEGASVNARDAEGSTPLMYAALYSSDPEMMRLLLKSGSDVNAANSFGATALLWGTNSLEKIRLLIENGADVNASSKLGKTALMVAASRSGSGPVVAFLLAHGARTDRKDSLTGIPLIPVGGGGDTALIQAAKARDGEALSLLLQSGADVNAVEKNGATALLNAIALKNSRNIKLLLDHGATLNAANAAGFSALMLAAMRDDPGTLSQLLARGVKVDAEDLWGNTALMWAASSEHARNDVAKLLLDAHADINHKNKLGETALVWASRRGKTSLVSFLEQSGASPVQTPRSAYAIAPAFNNTNVSRGIEQGLPMIQKAGPAIFKQRGCVSCHNNMLPTVAATMARTHGHKVDENALEFEHKTVLSLLRPAKEALLENADNLPDMQVTAPFALMALSAQGHKPDALTDAIVHNLANKQNLDGSWTNWAPRPPIEYGDIEATALSLRALQLYKLVGRRAEFDARIQAAGKWLAAAQPDTASDYSWRMLGLVWSNADRTVINQAVEQSLARQRPDGGWAQLPALESDAYATGQSLYALGLAGVPKRSPVAWKRGIDYLLSTQKADGTWLVRSRSFPFQPFFESGFPYGHDQWISSAGTSWAVIALTMAESREFEPVEALLRKP